MHGLCTPSLILVINLNHHLKVQWSKSMANWILGSRKGFLRKKHKPCTIYPSPMFYKISQVSQYLLIVFKNYLSNINALAYFKANI